MHFTRSVLIALALVPFSFGASREIVQMQRDLALLQDQVKTLQSTVDTRLATLTTLIQQALDASNKSNTSLAVLESGLKDRLSQQLSAPMTGVSTKVEQMGTEFQGVRENVSAMNETLSKVQAQLIDLNNAVKVLQTPAAPPPATGSAPGTLGAPPPGGMAAAGPPSGLSAQQLYDSAMRDRSGGNADLALQGFQEYLKWFGTSDLAPSAQFYVGQIYYDKGDFDNAVKAFDTVLERFAENNRTAEAMYMKGMSLLKSGQRTQAGQEFLNVIQKYPNSGVAPNAKVQRKALGLSVPGSAAAKPAARRRR
jgi:tol-pal system protein YbgF